MPLRSVPGFGSMPIVQVSSHIRPLQNEGGFVLILLSYLQGAGSDRCTKVL